MSLVWSHSVEDVDWNELAALYRAAPLGNKAPSARTCTRSRKDPASRFEGYGHTHAGNREASGERRQIASRMPFGVVSPLSFRLSRLKLMSRIAATFEALEKHGRKARYRSLPPATPPPD